MQLLIDLRAEARKAKNFAMADQIRQRLGSSASRWKIAPAAPAGAGVSRAGGVSPLLRKNGGLRPPLGYGSNRGEHAVQFLQLDRLGQMGVEAGVLRALAVFLLRVAGQGDEEHGFAQGGTDLPRHLEAVQPG